MTAKYCSRMPPEKQWREQRKGHGYFVKIAGYFRLDKMGACGAFAPDMMGCFTIDIGAIHRTLYT